MKRNMDESVICVDDVEMSSTKISPRDESITSKFEDQMGNSQEQFKDVAMTTTKYPYLESVRARFEQQRKEQEDRVKVLETKREVEIAHSKYLKKNVVDSDKMPEAKFVVDAWVKKHGKVGKAMKRLTNNKHRSTPKKENRTNVVLTPSYKNRISHTVSKTESVNRSNVDSVDSDSVIVLSDDDECYMMSSRGSDVDGPCTSSYEEKCNGPSSSGVTFQNKKTKKNSPDLVMEDAIDGTEDHIICSVIGCGAVFSSKLAKNRHDENFSHSPCNPLLLNINCELTPEEKYICPKCSKICKRFDGCQHHMNGLDHLRFLSPLPFGGFICPQCLSIFNCYHDCWNHMVAMKHKSVAYPFEDDFTNNRCVYPVPVSSQFVKEFCGVCEAVSFKLKCVDCGIRINSPLQLTQHLTDTCHMHCVSVSATSTQIEVFSMFLSSHQCSKCLCLCEKTDGNDDLKHKCSKKKSGHIVDLNCKSFLEFVTMCGIRCYGNSVAAVMSSEDEDDSDEDGEEDELLTCSQVLKKNERKKNKITESKDNKERMSFRIPNIQTTLDCQKSPVVNEIIPEDIQSSRSLGCRKSPVVNEIIPENVQNSRTDPFNLIKMKNIVLVDFDNWSSFFQKLTDCLPDKTFVWGFYGGCNVWKEPVRCPPFDYQKKNGRFHLHDRCGQSKDAADFAICITVGKLDASLPKDIAFTILSGDKGFMEVERQLRNSERKTVVINPHDAQKISPDMILSMVASVTEK